MAFPTEELFQELNKTINVYQKKFGEGSTERCIEFLFDPWHPDEDEYAYVIKILSEAIKNNEPLKQMSEEEFANIRF